MKKRTIVAVVGAIAIGFFVGYLTQPLISGDSVYNQLKKFDYVLNTTYKNYVDEVDPQKLVEAAIKGMLNELDPHSVYINADQMQKVKEDFQGSFDGIGVEFDVLNDTITVVSAISGGPSAALGIMPGDKIVKIDNEKAVGLTRDDVPKKLRGPKGTKVLLAIKRAGEKELIDFDITRDKIPLYSVETSFIIDGSDVGYISINRFMATTHQEVYDALVKMKAQGMKRLVLDLRGNPGGYLDQAAMVADEFIGGNKTIVYTKSRKTEFDETLTSNPGGLFEKGPLVVLVDAGSASASEIVSGALQDWDRGLIVGETSFGKGLVQRQYEIGDGSAFRLTISHYYTPSGRCIQRPYDDKEKYRHLEGRLDLEEGGNISHELEQIAKNGNMSSELDKIAKSGNKDSLKIYKTAGGRSVLGGGGITPDFIVKYDTIALMTRYIRNKNMYFEFSSSYLNGKGSHLKAKYENNFSAFLREFTVDKDMIKDFRALAEKKEIKWDEKDYEKDKDFIKTIIKSSIARSIWGNNESRQVSLEMDRQVQKAIKLLPEAAKLSSK